MTMKVHKTKLSLVELFTSEEDVHQDLMREAQPTVLKGEMPEFLGAAPGERTELRQDYRASFYSRNLMTRIGKLELSVPRDRNGELETVLFERHQAARSRWCPPWPRCMSKAFRPGR